jgi:hypothetical protein
MDVAKPCPRCLALYEAGKIRGETVMPLPEQTPPRAIYGAFRGQPCCFDCQAADNLIKCGLIPGPGDGVDQGSSFVAARIVVGNERQELFRMPGYRGTNNINKLLRQNKPGDLGRHQDWLDLHGIDLLERDLQNTWPYWAERYPEAGPEWDAFSTNHKIDTGLSITLHEILDDTLVLSLLDDDGNVTAQYKYYKERKHSREGWHCIWSWRQLSKVEMVSLD